MYEASSRLPLTLLTVYQEYACAKMPRARAQTTRARYIMRPGAGEARVARVTIAVGDPELCYMVADRGIPKRAADTR